MDLGDYRFRCAIGDRASAGSASGGLEDSVKCAGDDGDDERSKEYDADDPDRPDEKAGGFEGCGAGGVEGPEPAVARGGVVQGQPPRSTWLVPKPVTVWWIQAVPD